MSNLPLKILLLLVVFAIGSEVGKRNISPAKTDKDESRVTTATADGVNIEKMKQSVLPPGGFTVRLDWGDLGQKLVATGVIDRTKFDKLFENQKDLFVYLETDNQNQLVINDQTAQFWVDVLWALGLAQKSLVLDEGPMQTAGNPANFASTGGWTLGRQDAMKYYSKHNLIPLTSGQQEKVREITDNIYRPCCGNSAAFPDCNHGMAILGLVELMVSQGYSEEEIYLTSLKFNTYWFPQTYLDLAYHFAKNGTSWDKVDPKQVLGKSFSSAMGYQAVRKQIGTIPGLNDSRGGSCGV